MRHGWVGDRAGDRTRAAPAAAALLAFACCSLAPRAHAAANMEVAVQDDPLFVGNNYYGRTKGLRHARQLGATRIRVNLSWTAVMPASQARAKKKPRSITWNFAQYDGLVSATNGTPLRVQFASWAPAPPGPPATRRSAPTR